jgi:hypothetical protein
MMVVMVMVMVSGSERRARKHRQEQGSEEYLFHGMNVARSPEQKVVDRSLRIKKGNGCVARDRRRDALSPPSA